MESTQESVEEELPEALKRWARRKQREDRELNRTFETAYRSAFTPLELEGRALINFGPGRFRHKYWRNADRLYDGQTWSQARGKSYEMSVDIAWNLLDREPVALESGSIAACYCSHVIEHAWDDDVAYFFQDVHRILRTGGVFRVACPDASLGIAAVARGDEFFYPQRKRHPAYMLLEWSSLITHERNSFRVGRDEHQQFLGGFTDPYAALDRASRLSDRSLQLEVGGHVNWFDVAKVVRMLRLAGFTKVFPSAYAQSVLPVLRDVRHFDSTDVHMSCYVEAVR